MFVNEVCLTLIVLGSMSFGCCVGMAVMLACKVSVEEKDGYQPEGGEFDTSNPPQGGSGVPELRR